MTANAVSRICSWNCAGPCVIAGITVLMLASTMLTMPAAFGEGNADNAIGIVDDAEPGWIWNRMFEYEDPGMLHGTGHAGGPGSIGAFTFNGTGVTVYIKRSSTLTINERTHKCGLINVSIDNVDQGTVSAASPASDPNVATLSVSGLKEGNHVLELRPQAGWVAVDYIRVERSQNDTNPKSPSKRFMPGYDELAGSIAPAASSYNLTALGKIDWVRWPDRKASGNQISGVTAAGWGTRGTYADDTRRMNWSDGSLNAAAANDHSYIWCNGAPNSGWTFTVPATKSVRTLHVIMGGAAGAQTKIAAHLSGGTVPDYSDIETNSNIFTVEYMITFCAAFNPQTLTVTVTHLNTGSESVDLVAAYLD